VGKNMIENMINIPQVNLEFLTEFLRFWSSNLKSKANYPPKCILIT
jgi:hypothetical protein